MGVCGCVLFDDITSDPSSLNNFDFLRRLDVEVSPFIVYVGWV